MDSSSLVGIDRCWRQRQQTCLMTFHWQGWSIGHRVISYTEESRLQLKKRCRPIGSCWWGLIRAMRFGRQMYPSQAAEWIFPADSASGHIVEQKEDRSTLSKWGNDLRQSFRTVATAAGVSEFDAKLLMNHAIPGVNAGYITRHKLLEDHLRTQQQAISCAVFAALGKPFTKHPGIRDWLGCGGTRRLVLATRVDQNDGPRTIASTETKEREAA